MRNNKLVINYYLEQINKKIEMLQDRNKTRDEKLIIAFRGEAREHKGSELQPSIFRSDRERSMEQYINDLMLDYNLMDNSIDEEIIKAIYAQHYLAKSRLLDVTFNVLPSIYFSCEKYPEKDGIVYIFAFPETYSPNSRFIRDYYSDILSGEEYIYPKNFKVITEGFFHDRIIAQDGGFILFAGKKFHPIDEIYYERIYIDKKDKDGIKNELKKLFSIDRYSIYPEIEEKVDRIKDILWNHKQYDWTCDIKGEIDSAINRIAYEYRVKKSDGSAEKINRWLRKEKEDLISYIKKTEDTEDNKKYIEDKFKFIELV